MSLPFDRREPAQEASLVRAGTLPPELYHRCPEGLGEALDNPIRRTILRVLGDSDSQVASEMAGRPELPVSISAVAYHSSKLVEAGALMVIQPRQGMTHRGRFTSVVLESKSVSDILAATRETDKELLSNPGTGDAASSPS